MLIAGASSESEAAVANMVKTSAIKAIAAPSGLVASANSVTIAVAFAEDFVLAAVAAAGAWAFASAGVVATAAWAFASAAAPTVARACAWVAVAAAVAPTVA